MLSRMLSDRKWLTYYSTYSYVGAFSSPSGGSTYVTKRVLVDDRKFLRSSAAWFTVFTFALHSMCF
jgi:hypothetical protein